MVWIFGSRAQGTHRPYSDLDLWIECDPQPSDLQKQSLADAFEESDIPFKVDLVFGPELLEAYREQVFLQRKLLGQGPKFEIARDLK